MDVLFVYMDADDRLVAGQVLLRKLPRDLQRQLRGDLSGLKGLNEVVILYAALLAHGPLGFQHLPALMAGVAVQAGGEDLLLGLVPVEDIADGHIQTALPGQDLGDGHLLLRRLVHELIDPLQQVQPPSGVLRSGNSGVDAAGDLVDVHADFMHLSAQGLDLRRGERLDRLLFQEAGEEGPLGQAALSGLGGQQTVLLWGQLYVQVVRFFFRYGITFIPLICSKPLHKQRLWLLNRLFTGSQFRF